MPNTPDHRDEWFACDAPPSPQMWESDNPVVAVLLGPDGEVITEFYARPQVPFGYAGGEA